MKTPVRVSFLRYGPVLLTALVGVIATIGAFLLVCSWEYRVADIDFQSKAKVIGVINADLGDESYRLEAGPVVICVSIGAAFAKSTVPSLKRQDIAERRGDRLGRRGLWNKLNMLTTAEGVETLEQLEHLRGLGCGEAQGYLLSPARPNAEVPGLLRALQADPGGHEQPVKVKHGASARAASWYAAVEPTRACR